MNPLYTDRHFEDNRKKWVNFKFKDVSRKVWLTLRPKITWRPDAKQVLFNILLRSQSPWHVPEHIKRFWTTQSDISAIAFTNYY